MVRRRKTIEVRKVCGIVNRMLSLDTVSAEEKCALCVLIEEVLEDTGNYLGFGWPNLSKERRLLTQPGDHDYYSRIYYYKE